MCKAPAADIRLGAIVMGIGVLLGVGTMLLRLRADRPTVPAAAWAARRIESDGRCELNGRPRAAGHQSIVRFSA
ncbi:MAG: hypothetical protein IIA51_11460 [Chloroflexi bacterium]|nr:hypothetical protein [Chloroflexota bacterium]